MMPRLLVITALLIATVGTVAAADLPPLRGAGAIDTEAALAAVARAREAASRDEHAPSARAFIDGLNHDGRLVGDVADELAFQKLWNEEQDKAVFYFRRYLARHGGAAGRDVRLGLALAYSWSGRQGDAAAVYRGLLAENPDDEEARLGLGRALIWDNRLHEGYQVLLTAERRRPASGPQRSASAFLLTVLDEYDPHAEIAWSVTRDSDELTVRRLGAVVRTNVRNILVEAGGGVARLTQDGRPDITVPRMRAGVIAPLAPHWTLHAYGWLDRYRSDGPLTAGGGELDRARLGADAWLTWLPAPRMRLDLGAGSHPVETYDAIDRDVHYEPVSLSADWRWARRWTLSGSGEVASYSDGNRRSRASMRLSWRRDGAWTLTAGPVAYYMDYTTPYPGGYWAPDWVRNASLAAAVKRHWGRVAVRLDGSWGLEMEQGAEAISVGGAAGHVGWRVATGWLLAADISHSRSRLASDSGYNRTALGVRVRALF
jgi:hypothetical protein